MFVWTGILFFILKNVVLLAQSDTLSPSQVNFEDFGGVILMDEIVVSATQKGFEVQDFIDMVQSDESFYKAFRNIRTRSYKAENDIRIFNKKLKQKAYYHSETKQTSDGNCRTMDVVKDSTSGKFYKKEEYRYYTAKLYDRLFFTHGQVCESRNDNAQIPKTSKKGMEKHVIELKKLIFSPGEKAEIPIIGKKTEIFSKKMSKYYDYAIQSKLYKDSIECYVFSAVVKPAYQNKKVDKTVIKSLHTYFEKSSFQVMARSYQLKYYGALFDFDVNMHIELTKEGETYLPEYLEYDGFWDVPFKKSEIAKFSARFWY